MKKFLSLSMTGAQHRSLHKHLYPGDNKEAVAFLACTRRDGDRRHRLMVKEVWPVPHNACSYRGSSKVTWPVESIVPLLEEALAKQFSVFKVHSHPTNYPDFSVLDDAADNELLPSLCGYIEHGYPHGSLIMLPGGQLHGRYLTVDVGQLAPVDAITVVGDDLQFWYAQNIGAETPDFAASHGQIFGAGTYEQLKRLSIAVIGCSGTGGPVIEQLFRLGVGELVLVDDDVMETRNVNRILNSTLQDAHDGKPKVNVFREMIESSGLDTRVVTHQANLWHPDVVRSVAQCDVVIGCMDSIDGRFLLNLLATYYTIPYFDLGVCIDTHRQGDNRGTIREACGTVHYLQPGQSSLMSRGLFDMSSVVAAGLKRNDPKAYDAQLDVGYIKGVQEQQPAVISLNMFAASLAIMELLARIHPFREDPNGMYASVAFSFASIQLFSDQEEEPCDLLSDSVGEGDKTPLLGLSELSDSEEKV